MSVAAWLLIAFAAVDWIATVILVRGARQLNEPALTERALASFILTLSATGIAVLAVAFLGGITVLPLIRWTLLVGALLLLSLPQLVWLLSFWRGRFR